LTRARNGHRSAPSMSSVPPPREAMAIWPHDIPHERATPFLPSAHPNQCHTHDRLSAHVVDPTRHRR
jgi:hypothetical protein